MMLNKYWFGRIYFVPWDHIALMITVNHQTSGTRSPKEGGHFICQAHLQLIWGRLKIILKTQIRWQLKRHMPFVSPIKLTEQFADWIWTTWPLLPTTTPQHTRTHTRSLHVHQPALFGRRAMPSLICWLIAFYTRAKGLSSVSLVPFILQITYRRCFKLPAGSKWKKKKVLPLFFK